MIGPWKLGMGDCPSSKSNGAPATTESTAQNATHDSQRSHFSQHSVEQFVVDLHPVGHASCERRVAVCLRGVSDRGRYVCDAVGLLEGDGDDRRLAPHGNAQVSGIVDLRMHDFRVRSDLQNLSSESELLAVLVAAPAPAILSADA